MADTPYSERPEWADLTPIPLADEGYHPVVAIDYTDDYRDAVACFRAVMAKEEHSERALELTARLIELNSANYTAWNYRRLCLDALGKSLDDEFLYVNRVGEDNPKNYQVWHHRGCLAKRAGASCAPGELAFTAQALREDAKNYHAWAHRQRVVAEFGLWLGELAFSAGEIMADVRNNSAWNERLFALRGAPGGVTAEVQLREAEYGAEQVMLAPNNESPWSFLRGLCGVSPGGGGAPPGPDVLAVLEKLVDDALSASPGCPQALAMRLDLMATADTTPSGGRGGGGGEAMAAICRELARGDPMRAGYWQFRESLLSA